MKSVYPFSRKLLADRKISDAEKTTKSENFLADRQISDAEKTTKSENFWLIDKFLMPKKRLSQKICSAPDFAPRVLHLVPGPVLMKNAFWTPP